MRPARLLLCLLPAVALGCGDRPREGACGLTAIAGATMLLQEFGVPNQVLAISLDSTSGSEIWLEEASVQ